MVQTKGAINGGFYQKTDDPLSQAPSVVVSVEDMTQAIQAITDAGGTILGSMDEHGERTL
ncbi:hypothetical protein D3C87_2140090 [compost metagenome]